MSFETLSPLQRAVLISGGQLAAGGVQTHLEYLIALLIENGVSVTIAASGSQWSSAAMDALTVRGCRFLMPPRALLRWRKLAVLWSSVAWTLSLWRQPFTVAYFIGNGRSHFFLKWLLGKHTPSIYHEIVDAPALSSIEDRLALSMSAVVANSHKVADTMRAAHPSNHIQVIPFLTADHEVPAPQTVAESPGTDGPLHLVYLGRLVSHKRPDQLVYRWRELTATVPIGPATLDIYGYDLAGEMLDSLQDYVQAQGLETQIFLHGAYDFAQVDACLAGKHVLVLPSLFEGLPLVLVEAMQRGIPFVACDAGGTLELANDNPDVIVTSTDWNDFAQGLREMAAKVRAGTIDPQRLHSWTEARYGYEVVSQRWLAALLEPADFFRLSVP